MLLVQVARICHVSLAHLTYGGSGFESMPVMNGDSPDISEITCCDHETGNPLAGLSGAQRARIIWPSSLASSGVGPCDVPFRYASEPTPCGPP